MDFYKKLSKSYDLLFKGNDATLDFLSNDLKPNSNILDACCRTGSNSISLSEYGYNVIGIDNINFMIDKARDNRGLVPVKFYSYDMRDISSKFKENQFDEIIALNNCLSFLMDEEEVFQTLKSMFSCLKEGGKIIVEILNYETIISTINTLKQNNVSLSQEYFKDSNSNKIILKEKLTTKNKYLEIENYSLEEVLLNLSKDKLVSMLNRIGFVDLEVFSDFNLSPYNNNSQNIIIRATKEECLLDDREDYEDYDVNIVKSKSKCCCKN